MSANALGETAVRLNRTAIDAAKAADTDAPGRGAGRRVPGRHDYGGLAEPVADLALETLVASRQGEFAPADPTVTRQIGREPVSLRDVLTDGFGPAR